MTSSCASLNTSASAQLVRELLRDFGAINLRVSGGCMEPSLPEGCCVAVVGRLPRPSEIALVAAPEGLRLHRVLWAPMGGRGHFRTCADRAWALDRPVPGGDVLGTAVLPLQPWRFVRTLVRAIGLRLRGRRWAA